MNKKNIAVLFGGQSSEHEVSCISATTIISNIDTDFYHILLIGITKEGHWVKVESSEDIISGTWRESKSSALLSPDATKKGIYITTNEKLSFQPIDVIFPVLHGKFGEDGTIQGLLELSQIPYVGCGVLASSVAMDKLYTKLIVDTLHIRQAKYVPVMKHQLTNGNGLADITNQIEQTLSYPVFVKPSNAGSSQGVSKAGNREELITALNLAVQHDRKILVEETIVGRELECAVLGGTNPRASNVGEILTTTDFYDYDAKYNNTESKTILSPELPSGVAQTIKDAAVEIFQAIDGYGLSRVDFFLEKDTNEVVFNEINTLPGFTSISMYPMLWEERGIRKKELVEKLIQLSFSRREFEEL